VGTDKAILTESRLRAGRWEGRLRRQGTTPPAVELWCDERRVGVAAVVAGAATGDWTLSAAVPADLISEGVTTILLREAGSTETLGHFAILAGSALDDDLRAEVDLLRAELDMLKKAFRRHCADGGS
jgi:hypothetical protein